MDNRFVHSIGRDAEVYVWNLILRIDSCGNVFEYDSKNDGIIFYYDEDIKQGLLGGVIERGRRIKNVTKVIEKANAFLNERRMDE